MPSNMLYLVRMDSLRKQAGTADGMIADYILSHSEQISRMTVWSLAEATHTSYASVCRFFKKLGLSGFREFKKLFSDDRRMGEINVPAECLIESDTPLSIETISERI